MDISFPVESHMFLPPKHIEQKIEHIYYALFGKLQDYLLNLENYNKICVSELLSFFIIQENEKEKDKLYTEELQKQTKTFLGFRNGAPEACKTMCFYEQF